MLTAGCVSRVRCDGMCIRRRDGDIAVESTPKDTLYGSTRLTDLAWRIFRTDATVLQPFASIARP
jgi:hypothetical protein